MSPFIARSLYRLQERMLGRRTFALLSQLRESQSYTREAMESLQYERLRRTVRLAYEHTAYWRELMDERDIRPDRLRSLDDLRRFPLLDKATLRKQGWAAHWLDGGRRVRMARTSGSTNTPLEFYTSANREAHINAARIRGHEWVGMRRGEREMYFWGSPIELNKQDRVKRVRDWLVNDGLVSCFNLQESSVKRYYRALIRFQPKCIFGFPSSIALFASIAQRQGLDLSSLKERGLAMVIATAEPLGENRQILADAFGVPVFDSYGLREVGLVCHDCGAQRMHCTEEQMIVETVDPETLEPTDGEGEIVVTNVVGVVMPMIRYRTGDIGRLSSKPCPCGLGLRTLEITGGRSVDFIVTSEGRWVAGYIFPYLMREVPGIVKLQARQERLGQVRVLVTTDERYSPQSTVAMRYILRKRLQCDDEIFIEQVDDIPPLPSGKHRVVVSQVAEELRRQSEYCRSAVQRSE